MRTNYRQIHSYPTTSPTDAASRLIFVRPSPQILYPGLCEQSPQKLLRRDGRAALRGVIGLKVPPFQGHHLSSFEQSLPEMGINLPRSPVNGEAVYLSQKDIGRQQFL
jgi:hypothetical protein